MVKYHLAIILGFISIIAYISKRFVALAPLHLRQLPLRLGLVVDDKHELLVKYLVQVLEHTGWLLDRRLLAHAVLASLSVGECEGLQLLHALVFVVQCRLNNHFSLALLVFLGLLSLLGYLTIYKMVN